MGQGGGRNADACVQDADRDLAALSPRCQPNLPAGLTIFSGIVQQIQEDLSEPRLIGLQENWLAGHCDSDVVALTVDQSPRTFESAFQHRSEVDTLLVKH